MMKSILALAGMASLLATAAPAAATNVIDINQPDRNIYLADFPHIAGLGQTFHQVANNISGAGLFLIPGVGAGTGNITISVWDNNPDFLGSTMLGRGTATSSAGQWVDVFWTPAATLAHHRYYLSFESDNATLGYAGLRAGGDFGYYWGAATWGANRDELGFYDVTFRTYTTGAIVAEPSAAPEPLSWAMMITGLGMVGATLRRRGTARLI